MSRYELHKTSWVNGEKGGLRAGDWEWSLICFANVFLFDNVESTVYF